MIVPAFDPIAVFAAYAWGVVIGQVPLSRLAGTLRAARGKSEEDRRDPNESRWIRAGQGLVERSLYVSAFLIGQPALVAGWLVLKAASGWREWSRDRGVFNTWATGAGMSVLFAGSGVSLAWGLTSDDPVLITSSLLGPVALTAFVWSLYARRFRLDRQGRRLTSGLAYEWRAFWDPHTEWDPESGKEISE